MSKNTFYLCILIIFTAGFSFGQTSNADNSERKDRANEIIRQARRAIYQKADIENIKAVSLISTGTTVIDSTVTIDGKNEPREIKSRQIAESDISVELPGKAKQNLLTYDSNKNPAENYSKIQNSLNGEKFSVIVDTVVEGKSFDLNSILNAPYMPESAKKQLREAQEKMKPTRESVENSISGQLYTILLKSLWGKEKPFIYVGKAEAGEVRADVLEIETETERQTRWFFDEKTHLLLMITDEIAKAGMTAKTTQYFSDYQLMSGIMTARKVNIETESSGTIQMDLMGKQIKSSNRSKTISENIIKDLKINPSFKPETFVVKESK